MKVQSSAIVIHEVDTGNYESILTLTSHDIHHHDGKSDLGPGRVFSEQDKHELMNLLSANISRGMEILDPHCLAHSNETLMWYRPRQKTTINIQGREVRVPLPSLVFLCHRRSLYVMAYRGEQRPDPETRLFFCGLPNIQSTNGNWCTGGNRLPERPRQHHIHSIERMFFESPFTHWGALQPTSADSMEGWFDELRRKPRFPMKSLPEHDKPLDRWFTSIVSARA
ncbi:PRTRC system protein B [Marinobacter subterrani]|uniref:PRTRC system protein B n=1 Tax=Marinobacter subterrani TaxID=1658765 RepID=UPI00235206C2|nr:PRTRC system protein B [Marinobacter subterrani]